MGMLNVLNYFSLCRFPLFFFLASFLLVHYSNDELKWKIVSKIGGNENEEWHLVFKFFRFSLIQSNFFVQELFGLSCMLTTHWKHKFFFFSVNSL